MTKLGVWITVSVTLAALILAGFLWAGLMYLFMGSSSARIGRRGGDRRRIRTDMRWTLV